MASNVFRAIVVLVVALAVFSESFTFTAQKVTTNAALKTKLKNLNTTLTKAVSSAFLIKAVKGVASQDTTIRNLMVAAYGVPMDGYMCIVNNAQNISDKLVTGAVTAENMTTAYIIACPSYNSSVASVMNAADAVAAKYNTTTPAYFAKFPLSVRNFVINASSILSALSADTTAASNKTAQVQALTQIATQLKAISAADRKKTVSLVPWSQAFVAAKGAQVANINKALTLLNTSIATGNFANANLWTLATKLSVCLTKKLPAIAKWVVNQISALTVTTAIKNDANVTDIANTVASYGTSLGPMLIGMAEFQNYTKIFVSGSYKLSA